MKRFFALSACVFALLVLGPARAPAGETPTEAQVRQVLREHPELVLDALEGHEELLYDLVQKGLEKKRLAEIRRRRLAQSKAPLKPAPAPGRAVRGPANAPVDVVAFLDFQFPADAKAWPVVKEVLDQQWGRVRYTVRHQIMGFNRHSAAAAAMFEAASMQDPAKAFRLHDLMLENRKEIEQGGEAALLKLAVQAGLDPRRLGEDMRSGEVKARLKADKMEARRLGITASPVYLMNGVVLSGEFSRRDMEEVMDMAGGNAR